MLNSGKNYNVTKHSTEKKVIISYFINHVQETNTVAKYCDLMSIVE